MQIDPRNLRFNETTLTQYIQDEAGFYDNFGSFLALAEKNLQLAEMNHEKIRNERFIEYKESGDAVALADAKADSDDIVCALKELVVEAKYMVARLRRHLYAWDKNHDNAQSLGHMLRKEMDKLNADIRYRSQGYDMFVEEDHSRSESHDVRIEHVVGELDVEALQEQVKNG